MKKIIFALMSVGGFMLAGCGGGAPAGKGGTPSDMPGWVMEQPPLCGVGIQKFRGNLGAAKAAAEGKARDDLSRQLDQVADISFGLGISSNGYINVLN